MTVCCLIIIYKHADYFISYKSTAEWLLHLEQEIATYNQAD